MKTRLGMVYGVLAMLISCTDELKENDGALFAVSSEIELQKEKPTAENSLYEGDLYRFYLNGEIETTDLEIAALQKLLDSGKDEADTKEKLQKAFAYRAGLKVELGKIQDVFIGVKPPRPPCPKPRRCDFDFDFGIAPGGSENLDIVIRDSKGTAYGGTTGGLGEILQPKGGSIVFKSFNLKKFKGNGTVAVKYTDSAGKTREYEFNYNPE